MQTRNVHAELFQSTPLHEGRPRPSMPVTSSRWQFQSTPLHEGRLYHRNKRRHRLPVSIHAPARGATDFAGLGMVPLKFQSTPLHEGRRYGIRTSGRRLAFQSTPLHEGRRESNLTPPKDADKFQSTPLHEGRHGPGRPRGRQVVSIHAPARGATIQRMRAEWNNMFQSTPLHEGRLADDARHDPRRGFQSTPLHEGRLEEMQRSIAKKEFQSTPLHEGRRRLLR